MKEKNDIIIQFTILKNDIIIPKTINMLIKRIIKYIYFRIKWKKACKFSLSTNISLNSTFEGMCQIHPHVTFHGHLGIGSYIGSYSSLSAEIGRFTSIAPNVRCNCGIHPYKEPFVTTSPCFFP